MTTDRFNLTLWEWLAGPEGSSAIEMAEKFLQEGVDELGVLSGLRRFFGVDQSAAAIVQAELRRRGSAKFSNAAKMLFTERGLSQSSSEAIARYKATRFDVHPVADLCCGIGGDLIAASLRGTARGVDKDPVAAFCAAYNLRVYGCDSTDVLCDDVEKFELDSNEFVHLDPDRRLAHGRTVDLNNFEPNLPIIEKIMSLANAALKLAPATRVPDEWHQKCQIEWIGHRGECKQQIVWTGELAQSVGRRMATVLANDGSQFEQLVESPTRAPAPATSPLAPFLFEPHAAVLTAGLHWELAALVGGRRISNEIVYLSASQPTKTLLASCFELLEAVPLKPSAVDAVLRKCGAGVFEIKTRGLSNVDLTAFRNLKMPEPRVLTLILTRVVGHPRALICRRCATH